MDTRAARLRRAARTAVAKALNDEKENPSALGSVTRSQKGATCYIHIHKLLLRVCGQRSYYPHILVVLDNMSFASNHAVCATYIHPLLSHWDRFPSFICLSS